jgi:16S rRNA (uracil1498-N3)-methyltransferase
LEDGQEILLLLPHGGALKATWNGFDFLELAGLCEIPRLPLLPITLATAWPKGSRADDLIVRATEAGVERIVPLICERSIAGRKGFSKSRLDRWNKLARETCQQCNRPFPPILSEEPVPLKQAIEEAPPAKPLVLQPDSFPLGMSLTLEPPKEIMLLVGPEGGFSPEEMTYFQSEGIQRVGILPTILRIESAGPAAATICQHWFFQLNAS